MQSVEGLYVHGGTAGNALAFSQHYAVKVAMSRHLDIDPWNNYPQIVRADFGDAVTPVGALVANPSAFARHVAANARTAASSGHGRQMMMRADLLQGVDDVALGDGTRPADGKHDVVH